MRRGPRPSSSPRRGGEPRARGGKPEGRPHRGPDPRARSAHGPAAHGPAAHDPAARARAAHAPASRDTTTSPRVAVPAGKPLAGPWLWLSRPGSELDVAAEIRLALGERARATEIAPGLARSELAPTFDDGTLDVTFARHGVRVKRRVASRDEAAVLAAVREVVRAAPSPVAIDVLVPDSDDGNRWMTQAASLADALRAALGSEGIESVPRDRAEDREARLIDVVLVPGDEVIVGEIEASLALTLHAQGRARMKVAGDRPSRAARKVEEALDWLGLSPGPGEVCVDLGAAPGGWSWSLLERRARVIAVDPAQLRPDVARHPRLTHVQASAFQYQPEQTVDWLFCDMAWRPREAAQMLAKWARRSWARFLVANLKLPMKTKAAMVRELREILAGGGWTRVRTRQLYHDRDEITVTAHR